MGQYTRTSGEAAQVNFALMRILEASGQSPRPVLPCPVRLERIAAFTRVQNEARIFLTPAQTALKCRLIH
jgi:hypothetical protein